MTNLLKVTLGALLISCGGCQSSTTKEDSTQPSKKRPNVVLVMADDLGYGDLSCYGNKTIGTPNIDSLAHHGLRLTNYHSNGAVCSPTRASLLTGLYPQEAGIEGVVTAKSHRDTGLPLEKYTIAEFLQGEGYSTAVFGKWHLGYSPDLGPTMQGFDRFTGFVSGNVDYISHIDQEGYADWWNNENLRKEEGYLTELITDRSIDFLATAKDKPFFLYVAHGAPHYPFQGPNDKADRTVNGDFSVYGSRQDVENAYAEMITSLDENVGRLMTYLKTNGLLENTLVIFCSDNGAPKIGSNAPWAGHKGQLFEGGHRVPAIFYWKGAIKPGTSDALVLSMDIFPTIADLFSLELEQEIYSGRSVAGLFTNNESPISSPERIVFWRFKEQKAARKGKWKLLIEDGQSYLFDLEEDRRESTDVKKENVTIYRELKQAIEDWEANLTEEIRA